MSTARDPHDTFELILDPADVLMPPASPSRARVQPRASDWVCLRCGATVPADVLRCDHSHPSKPTHAPDERDAEEVTLAGGTPRSIAAAECGEHDEHIAFALRDVADLVAVHKLSLPDALREVADRIAPKR